MRPLPPVQQQAAPPSWDRDHEQPTLFDRDPEFRRQFYAFVRDPDNDDYTNSGDEATTARPSQSDLHERGQYIGLRRPHTD